MIKIDEQFNVPGVEPRAVWKLLADPHNVVECVQGATLGQEHEDGSFDGSLSIKFGPAKVTFRARIELELNEEEMVGRVTARGKDSQGGTRFRATMSFTVIEHPEGCGATVLVEGENELSGKLAGIVEAGAKIVVARMAADFADKLSARCAAMNSPVDQDEPESIYSLPSKDNSSRSSAISAVDSGVSPSQSPAPTASRVAAKNIDCLREMARKRLPCGIFEFVERGSDSEVALRNNRLVFDHLRLFPRGLVDVSQRSTKTMLFGREQSMPIAVAPTGAADLLWYKGEIELAKAAAAADVPFTVSARSMTLMENVAEVAGGRLWFQLQMWPERSTLHELLARVKTAGYEALVVTIDTVPATNCDYNGRHGFQGSPHIHQYNALDVARHPHWMFSVMARNLLSGTVPRREDYAEELRQSLIGQPGKAYSAPNNVALTWDDLLDLRKHWNGPLIVKGVMHPEDARRAVECGADGVVISNHGGRNFDSAMTSMEALSPVVDAVGQHTTVMIDGGFLCGADVVKALALGAKAVLLGRAPLYGLAAAGKVGAERVFEIFHESISQTMAYMGCGTLEQVTHTGVAPNSGWIQARKETGTQRYSRYG